MELRMRQMLQLLLLLTFRSILLENISYSASLPAVAAAIAASIVVVATGSDSGFSADI